MTGYNEKTSNSSVSDVRVEEYKHDGDNRHVFAEEADPLPVPDSAALKSAIRKLDFILVPTATLIYLFNFLDRANIGNAKAAGMDKDLGITSHQWSIALTMTYVPYILAEMPLTMLVRKVGANILIPILVISWGLVTTFQGFINSFAGLVVARVFLGACEGAILPALITVLSSFYRRRDMGKRIAVFFSATSLAGAFSGLLAAGILNMEGVRGMRGWRWILIIEGIATVLFGAATFFVLPRTPETTWWLKQDERDAVVAALNRDRNAAEEAAAITKGGIFQALTAPQLWLMFAQFFASGTMLFGLAYFAPTIVGELGYKGIDIQLYSVPPYACSAVVAFICCYVSDSTGHRGIFVIFASALSTIGYALYLASSKNKILYGSLFLQVIGSYTAAPLQSTWMPNNLAPYTRRVTGIIMGFIATNMGGILSTWLFPKEEAKRFTRGTSILLAMAITQLVLAAANMAYLGAMNRKRHAILQSRIESSGENAWNVTDHDDKPGDESVHFKYIL